MYVRGITGRNSRVNCVYVCIELLLFKLNFISKKNIITLILETAMFIENAICATFRKLLTWLHQMVLSHIGSHTNPLQQNLRIGLLF